MLFRLPAAVCARSVEVVVEVEVEGAAVAWAIADVVVRAP